MDKLSEALANKREYSNTVKSIKRYTDIDLTVNQDFQEEEEILSNTKDIDLRLALGLPDSDSVIREGRFWHNFDLEEESEFRAKLGCECCGRQLTTSVEQAFGICAECDRVMFSPTRARFLFPTLNGSVTCISREFYRPQFNRELRFNNSVRNLDERGLISWIKTYIGRKKHEN